MKRNVFLMGMATLVIVAIAGVSMVASAQSKMTRTGPSIEGTYKLMKRTTPDGKTLTPPDIQGLQTFTRSHRNFNVVWADNTGKHFSYSVASTYKLTDHDYTESLEFSIMNDEIGGKPIVYTMKGTSKTVPVTVMGSKVSFHLPFDPPDATFDGNTLVATAPGQFTDTWERVP